MSSRVRWAVAAACIVLGIPARAGTPAQPLQEQTYLYEDGTSFTYTRPTAFGWIARGFGDLAPFARSTFAADNLVNLGLILGTTAVLVRYDQRIFDDVQSFGRHRGISQDAVGSSVKELPRNFGNWMYFIGDGRIPIAIAGAFAGTGYLRDDIRMMSVSSQLAEVMVSTGVICQGMKILTGRETPELRTKDGGAWHGPVGVSEYLRHQNRYDAMPSGHLATLVGAITVLAENYQDHEVAIYSVGGVLATMLSFQMVNNGVHWASDYPIAVAIGYSLGSIAVNNNRRGDKSGGAEGLSFHLAMADGALEFRATARF